MEIRLILIWWIIALAEVLRHVYVRKKLKRSPNKFLSLTLRVIAAGVIWYYDPYPLRIVSGLAYLYSGWCMHDYLQNIILGTRPIWTLNNTGPLDRLQQKPNPFVWFCWKVIFFIVFVGAYFFNEV
jgi:hypothetical protein